MARSYAAWRTPAVFSRAPWIQDDIPGASRAPWAVKKKNTVSSARLVLGLEVCDPLLGVGERLLDVFDRLIGPYRNFAHF